MSRDEKIRRLHQGITFAKQHIEESNFNGAVVVAMAVIEQMLALIEGEDLDNVSDPDVIVYNEVDFDGQDQLTPEGR
jgi:hypothetical protein